MNKKNEYMRFWLSTEKGKAYMENRLNPEYKTKKNAQDRQRYVRIRASILAAYGSRCNCCGETEPKFLCIDHVNNDGAEHRRQIGGAGLKLFREVIKSEFSDRFQILCYNCNMVREYHAVCPHQETR